MKRLAIAAALLLAACAFAEQRATAQARIECKPVPADELSYDCTVHLAGRDGAPLDDLRVSIGADMPSMPMAHNVRPVAATRAAPGTYRARLELEMHGHWALKLRLAGAVNDLLVLHMDFEPNAATPRPR